MTNAQRVNNTTLETFKDLREDSVNSDPLIVLGCGHVFTTSTMDQHMKLEDFYDREHSGGIRRYTYRGLQRKMAIIS